MFSFPSVPIPSLSVARRQDPERKWGGRGARKSERAGHSGGKTPPVPQMTPFSSCSQPLNLLKSADSEQRVHWLTECSVSPTALTSDTCAVFVVVGWKTLNCRTLCDSIGSLPQDVLHRWDRNMPPLGRCCLVSFGRVSRKRFAALMLTLPSRVKC